MMNGKKVLEEALNIIQERGWHKGEYQGADGSVCMLGAMRIATWGSAYRLVHPHKQGDLAFAMELLAQGLSRDRTYTSSSGAIIAFNDHSQTTEEDVILAFKKAIYE